MLSRNSISAILNYFDQVDAHVSSKLKRKFPWPEESLTVQLCDLLDVEAQREEGAISALDDLNELLKKYQDDVTFTFQTEVACHSKYLEHQYSHADLGIVVSYENNYSRERISKGWLLQAKRLFPVAPSEGYLSNSKFRSFDREQHEKILFLSKQIKCDFFKYLLYCPRLENLDPYVRGELTTIRDAALAERIFDFESGLILFDEWKERGRSLNSGVIVANVNQINSTTIFSDIHHGMFTSTLPFSWFILNHFFKQKVDYVGYGRPDDEEPCQSADLIVEMARGNKKAFNELARKKDQPGLIDAFVFPRQTIEITVRAGNKKSN